MYRDQIEDEPAVRLFWDGRLFVGGFELPVGDPAIDWHPDVADPPQPDEEG
jgi:hypothetical protein